MSDLVVFAPCDHRRAVPAEAVVEVVRVAAPAPLPDTAGGRSLIPRCTGE